MEWVPCSAKVGSYVWSVDSTHQALPELWFPYIHPSCNSMKHEGNLGIGYKHLFWFGLVKMQIGCVCTLMLPRF